MFCEKKVMQTYRFFTVIIVLGCVFVWDCYVCRHVKLSVWILNFLFDTHFCSTHFGSSLCFTLFDYQSVVVYWFCKEREKHVSSDGSGGKENLRRLGGGKIVIRTHYSIKNGMQKNHFSNQ